MVTIAIYNTSEDGLEYGKCIRWQYNTRKMVWRISAYSSQYSNKYTEFKVKENDAITSLRYFLSSVKSTKNFSVDVSINRGSIETLEGINDALDTRINEGFHGWKFDRLYLTKDYKAASFVKNGRSICSLYLEELHREDKLEILASVLKTGLRSYK